MMLNNQADILCLINGRLALIVLANVDRAAAASPAVGQKWVPAVGFRAGHEYVKPPYGAVDSVGF